MTIWLAAILLTSYHVSFKHENAVHVLNEYLPTIYNWNLFFTTIVPVLLVLLAIIGIVFADDKKQKSDCFFFFKLAFYQCISGALLVFVDRILIKELRSADSFSQISLDNVVVIVVSFLMSMYVWATYTLHENIRRNVGKK